AINKEKEEFDLDEKKSERKMKKRYEKNKSRAHLPYITTEWGHQSKNITQKIGKKLDHFFDALMHRGMHMFLQHIFQCLNKALFTQICWAWFNKSNNKLWGLKG
ncbi:hypothetical protein ACJX0J_010419, partial [Zea mays]